MSRHDKRYRSEAMSPPVVECGNRETDGNGEEAAKEDITESKRTINKKV